MRKIKTQISTLILIFLFAYGCQKEHENQPPTCEIISPTFGAKFQKGEEVTISVEANDVDGEVKEVRFYIDGIGIYSTNKFPYTYGLITNELEQGNHIIKIIAIDNENKEGEASSEFYVELKEPTVLTGEIKGVTNITAVCKGEVIDDGGADIEERGICWSLSSNPTVNDNKSYSGDGIGKYESSIDNLNPGTKYFVRAFAKNEIGFSYGEIKSFTTALEVITNDVRNSTEISAFLVGDVIGYNFELPEPSKGFYWSKDNTKPDSLDNLVISKSVGDFWTAIFGLQPNTTYYYRAFAKYGNGIGIGAVKSFTTRQNKGVFDGETGELYDNRDGKTYKTVKIGTQTWMAENLAYKSENGCWAYNNDESNVKNLGYYYNWETAKNVCPEGWHLPSADELKQLFNYISKENGYDDSTVTVDGSYRTWNNVGDDLKSKMGWKDNGNGTDKYGFSGLPCGQQRTDVWMYNSSNLIYGGYWWSSTSKDSEHALTFYLYYDENYVVLHDRGPKTQGRSVRCIKNQ